MLIVTVPGGYMELWLPFEHFLQNFVLKNDLAVTTVQESYIHIGPGCHLLYSGGE